MSRCFVGLRPPPEVVDAVTRVCGDELDGVRWVRPEQLHVTLRFFPEVEAERLIEAVSAIAHDPVEVRGGPFVRPMFGHVLAVPIDGVDGLASAVAASTAHLHADGRPFRGHLTVGRLRHDQPQPTWSRRCAVSWSADTVSVVESRPVSGRHQHRTLAEVRLGGTRA